MNNHTKDSRTLHRNNRLSHHHNPFDKDIFIIAQYYIKANSNLEGEFVSLGNGGGYKKVGNVVTVNSYFVVGETPGSYVLATNLPMPIEVAALNTFEFAHGTVLRSYINKNRELVLFDPTTSTTNKINITGSYICV